MRVNYSWMFNNQIFSFKWNQLEFNSIRLIYIKEVMSMMRLWTLIIIFELNWFDVPRIIHLLTHSFSIFRYVCLIIILQAFYFEVSNIQAKNITQVLCIVICIFRFQNWSNWSADGMLLFFGLNIFTYQLINWNGYNTK